MTAADRSRPAFGRGTHYGLDVTVAAKSLFIRPLTYHLKSRLSVKTLGTQQMTVLGHVEKWRTQRRIDVMSMKPKKL